MNTYWTKERSAVQDGGNLRSDQACALFDYITELEFTIRRAMNESTINSWIDVSKLMDRGPKEPTL